MEIYKLLSEAVRFRDEIGIVLESLDAREVEQGLLVLKASLLSQDLKPFVMAQARDMLSDYTIKFENGLIKLWATIDAKQLGPVEVEYAITVTELRFEPTGHKLYATFKETVNAQGNMVQKIALKAALLNGPLIKTALKIGNLSYLYVDGNNLLIDFDQLAFTEKIPDNLRLKYISSENSRLTLSFR